jgi:hypothetical protein
VIAEAHVEGARDEKRNDDHNKDEVTHKITLTVGEF